jgi:phosphohistidine swiveling domain-containing protein
MPRSDTAILSVLGGTGFDAAAAGRKATPLHELMRAGFAVPPGFVVPPDVPLDARMEAQLEAAVTAMGGYPVAARSSGHLEDLPGASFAGQYVTRLDIADARGLLEAIDECRAAARSPQVTAYLRKNGLDESQARVSVLTQRMVDAAIAGVAFSIHPTTGREEHALLECCHGLGEKLVSGRTAPTRYVIHLVDGSVVDREEGEEDVRLDDVLRMELRDRILELQAHFGAPQDIEWAVDHRKTLWILQSRPITRIQWRTDIDEFTSADFREGGVSARVCTPLMYSLYRDAFQASMQRYFVDIRLLSKTAPQRTWIDMFYGRPYWSASAVKNTLLNIPGFDEEVFDKDLGIQKKYGASGPATTPTTIRTLLPAIPVAIALERNYRRHLRLTESYGRTFLPREAQYLQASESLARMTDQHFFRLLREVMDFQLATECDYFTTIYNNANLQSDLKKLLASIAQVTGTGVSAVDLMSGLQDVSHMKMQSGLVRLVGVARRDGMDSPAWDRELNEFLSANYFHGDVELDISTPRWGERPERVKQIVADILRSGSEPKDPEYSARAQHDIYTTEERRILDAVRSSWWLRLRLERRFRKRLTLARAYLSRREEMREYSTRAYHLVRRVVLEAGARFHRTGTLRTADDVFMLQRDEILAGAEASDPRRLEETRYRRLLHRGYRLLEPPGELGRDVTQRTLADQLDAASSETILRGIGCSAGIVRAAIRVIRTLEETDTLKPGEILVTRFTDPGWTPVLGLVAGIITEVGGLLSHAAVIGREYGIPAVLNVAGATQLLKTGQQVEIDGSEGTVRLMTARSD